MAFSEKHRSDSTADAYLLRMVKRGDRPTLEAELRRLEHERIASEDTRAKIAGLRKLLGRTEE